MNDIYEDIRIVVQRHREQAAAEERAKAAMFFTKQGLRQIANSIANKEHLK
jgi:hypothetical protein